MYILFNYKLTQIHLYDGYMAQVLILTFVNSALNVNFNY